MAAYTQGLAPDGRESLVVVAKGTFDLPLDGSEARLADVQRPLLMADGSVGEPGLSAPRQEMDFAPLKPFCDVLVIGAGAGGLLGVEQARGVDAAAHGRQLQVLDGVAEQRARQAQHRAVAAVLGPVLRQQHGAQQQGFAVELGHAVLLRHGCQ
eukprot:gene46794-57302_t